MHVFGCKMIMDGLWIDFHALRVISKGIHKFQVGLVSKQTNFKVRTKYLSLELKNLHSHD